MWSHEFDPKAMKFDGKWGLIHLQEKKKQKTYPFSAIKKWRYNLSTRRQRTCLDRVLDRTHDFRDSGFYIAFDDVKNLE